VIGVISVTYSIGTAGDVQVQTLPACKVEDFFTVMSEHEIAIQTARPFKTQSTQTRCERRSCLCPYLITPASQFIVPIAIRL
jgi:hypothetical protein